jgi:hypothetical protein
MNVRFEVTKILAAPKKVMFRVQKRTGILPELGLKT